MLVIMKNTFITAYHRQVRRNTFIDTTDNLHFINSSDFTTTNSAVSEFVINDIKEAVEELKGEYKTPFMMHFNGYKYFEIADILDIPIGERQPIEEILQDIRENVDQKGINPASGKHFGYIPGGGVFPSALGDYLAAVSNRYAGIFFASAF